MDDPLKIGGSFEKSCVPLIGGRGVKNCQNHAKLINEWPLTCSMGNHQTEDFTVLLAVTTIDEILSQVV